MRETYVCMLCGEHEELDLPERLRDPCQVDDVFMTLNAEHGERCADPSLVLVREGQAVIGYVNAYTTWQSYGGPEEGGWYYLSGKPIAAVPLLMRYTKDEHGRMRPACPPGERERVEQTIVELFGARDVEVRVEGVWPLSFPPRRPVYE